MTDTSDADGLHAIPASIEAPLAAARTGRSS